MTVDYEELKQLRVIAIDLAVPSMTLFDSKTDELICLDFTIGIEVSASKEV
jgi:hypothetical protein